MSSLKTSAPIKYLLMGDVNTGQMMTEYVLVKNQQVQNESKQIFEKLSKSPDKKIDERNKIQSNNGNYYFTISPLNVFYLILVDSSYPERFVFLLIENINKERIPLMVTDKNEINASGRQILKNLVDKYQEEKSKIGDIQSDVDDIKLDMNQNIKKIVANMDDIRDLENKSQSIKLNAHEYRSNAHELEKVTWWQNCKWKIIIGAIIIGILLAIILPICLKS